MQEVVTYQTNCEANTGKWARNGKTNVYMQTQRNQYLLFTPGIGIELTSYIAVFELQLSITGQTIYFIMHHNDRLLQLGQTKPTKPWKSKGMHVQHPAHKC